MLLQLQVKSEHNGSAVPQTYLRKWELIVSVPFDHLIRYVPKDGSDCSPVDYTRPVLSEYRPPLFGAGVCSPASMGRCNVSHGAQRVVTVPHQYSHTGVTQPYPANPLPGPTAQLWSQAGGYTILSYRQYFIWPGTGGRVDFPWPQWPGLVYLRCA